MAEKLQRAKALFQAKQFEQAKNVIIDIVDDGNTHYKLQTKLGDICIELEQYSEAIMYYQQSIESNPLNPSIYNKYGILLHQYLNIPNEAESMYQKCIKLTPKTKNNDNCWFNYGKLLYQEKKFSLALEYLLKCETERACIHYYHALALRALYDKQHQQLSSTKATKIQYLLLRATKLQPNVAKYHHQYALSMSNTPSLCSKTDEAFETALKLSDGKDPNIVNDYNTFKAKYIEKLSPYVYDKNISIIAYEFDEVITYSNLKERVKGKISKLHKLRSCEVGLSIFGGYDRVSRLCRHFQRILSSNHVIIVIISQNKTNIIKEALKRVNLYQYFSDANIIGSEHDDDDKSILCTINELRRKYSITSTRSVLYVDNKMNNIRSVTHCCRTLDIGRHRNNNKLLRGLTLKDMLNIESMVGVAADEFHPDSIFCHEITTNLKENKRLYYSIKSAIKRCGSWNNFIHCAVFKYLKYKLCDNIKKKDYINFSHKLYTVIYCKPRHWTLSNIIDELLQIEPKNTGFQRKYGTALSYLGHIILAEEYLVSSVKYNNPYCVSHLEYAMYLFKCNRLTEAEGYFRNSLQRMNKIKNRDLKYMAYLGLARTLQWMQNYERAEYYYILSMNVTSAQPYYHYAKFLYSQQRYKESQHQFSKALSRNKWPNGAHHYLYSKTLLKLGEYEAYEFQLKKALKIDPWLIDAKNNLNLFRYQCMRTVLMDNHILIENSIYMIEFDRFWFDRIGVINKRFNKYYDYFILNQINDIRYILFQLCIEKKLKDIMGILVLEDLKLIMENVKKIRIEHKQFIETLKHKNLHSKFNSFYKCFVHHGIFTAESFKYYVKSAKDWKILISHYSLYNQMSQQIV